MDYSEKRLPPNPIAKANPISKIFFLWLIPFFRRGYKKELETEDLYDVLKHDSTGFLGDKLEKAWEKELEAFKRTGKKPSLLRAIIKLAIKPYLFTSCFYFINQCVSTVGQAYCLRLLIVTFNEDDVEKWKAYVYAGAVSFAAFLNTITIHPSIFQTMLQGMRFRIAITSLIYRKSLRLSKSAQNKTNAGQIVNLLSNDATRFDLGFNFLPFLITAPFQFGLLMFLMYQQIGPACFAGAAFLVLLLPLQYLNGKYSARFRALIAKQTDERGRVMNEIIVGMRVIKQYAWEKPFSLLIDMIRKAEVVELKKKGYLRGSHVAMINFAPKLVQFMTFLAFVLLEDDPMTSDKVFFTIACLQTIIQITIHFIPLATSGIGEIYVAVHRVQDFLLLEEQTTNNNLKLYSPPAITSSRKEKSEHSNENNNENNNTGAVVTNNRVRITMQNVCASWTGERRTLDDVSFSAEDDKLVMVVGPVGSSKTSLLHAIIDELPISSGNLSVRGTVAYASQEPWIFAGNLRQNILFGLPYDESRYNDTIKFASLEEDLKQLPYGDMTFIGERGVALSGGQKARVNLARALYRDADIYLMDDPLSAVDTKVSRQLFDKCIKEYLRGRIRVLVTHQLQYMPQADHIILLFQGKILSQGTYQELIDSGIDFISLMASSESEETLAKRKSIAEESQKIEANQQKLKEEEEKEQEKPAENVESKAVGSVSGRTYWNYFLSGHSVPVFFFLLFAIVVCQVFTSGNDYWLTYWSNAEATRISREVNCTKPNKDDCDEDYLGENIYLYVFTGFIVAVTITNMIRGVWFFHYCAGISINIHDKMFRAMARAPIKFFDDNPSGRIMNRFTKDIGTIDELLPLALMDTLTIFLQIFGVIVVVIISNYYLAVPTVLLFAALYLIRRFFIETARDVKRIESITRSPIYTHVVATVGGLTTIRACHSEKVLIQQFEGHQVLLLQKIAWSSHIDIHTSSWYLFLASNRWFGMFLELITDVFLLVVAFSFLLISTSDQGGNVGLAIASILGMMGNLQWGVRQSVETENYMISTERAFEYARLKPEAELESSPSSKPPPKWPELGQVEFKNVTLKYDEAKPPVLKQLTFKIRPREKIGIVGRTGAGKSSIIAALFRMAEPEGQMLIDDVIVNNIGLHDLRKNISIIPQDPVLFSGTVRYNLDPFNQFDDVQLWRVIEEVELKDAVSSLDYKVTDGGGNFSVGQRQLVCLARAILRKNRILVMDEATANVDPSTDHLIQQTIRSKFADCTIITIAHRLHSIIDCDRILVLDHGNLKEYDHPHLLLQTDGIFTAMVAQTGQSSNAMLRKMALDAYGKQNPSTHTTGEQE